MLSLTTVEADQRICGGDCRRVRKLQLADPAYDKQLAIDVIIYIPSY